MTIISRMLLVAEDDESDVFLLQRAFRDAKLNSPIHFVRDGQAVIEFLQERCSAVHDQLPSLLILDLKMPRRSGLEVLQWLREQPVLHCLPAFVFSSSARQEDVERAYALGANGFMVKPPSVGQRLEMARFIKDWLQFNEGPIASVQGFKAAQTAFDARNLGLKSS